MDTAERNQMKLSSRKIPVMRPLLPRGDRVLPYLEAMTTSGVYANFGPLTRKVEERYADMLGVSSEQVVTATNATLGLAGAMAVLPRDLWLLPAFTFPATAHAAALSSKGYFFRDVDPEQWVMQPRSGDTSADYGVLPVVPFGAAPNLAPWFEWPVGLVDAAASLGNMPSLRGLQRGWAVVFSLHATKVLGCGEGALVVFGDPDFAAIFRRWSNFGLNTSREVEFLGSNAKMAEPAAAYALAALDGWECESAEWRTSRQLASDAHQDLGIDGAPDAWSSINPYWITRFTGEFERQAVERTLLDHGVETRRWWSFLPAIPAFSNAVDAHYPTSQELHASVLGLPMFRGLSARQVRVIIEALDASKSLL